MFKTGYDYIPDLEGTPFGHMSDQWAWGGASGKGIKVAVIDSGIDASHPALENCVKGSVEVFSDDGKIKIREVSPSDAFGHGTACAGVIHGLAPEAEIYSVKVLGTNLRGTGDAFLAGLKWAIIRGIPLVNLSLGTAKTRYFAPLHSLADNAYFKRSIVVAAQSNSPTPGFPAVFSSIIGVKAIYRNDPFEFYFNGNPPVEFLIRGVDVKLPWLDHGYETCTGNSFAAPHLTGIIALMLSKHRWMTPFIVKSVLYANAVKRGRFDK